MSPEKQLIAIAEMCGWKNVFACVEPFAPVGINPKTCERETIPAFLSDMDAMREADPDGDAATELCRLLGIDDWTASNMIAMEILKHLDRWPEAFLRAKGKWES